MTGDVSGMLSYCACVRQSWPAGQTKLAVKVAEAVTEGALSSVTVTVISAELIGSRACVD